MIFFAYLHMRIISSKNLNSSFEGSRHIRTGGRVSVLAYISTATSSPCFLSSEWKKKNAAQLICSATRWRPAGNSCSNCVVASSMAPRGFKIQWFDRYNQPFLAVQWRSSLQKKKMAWNKLHKYQWNSSSVTYYRPTVSYLSVKLFPMTQCSTHDVT